MLIETNITIAYKCSSCGSFKFLDLSLFDLSAGECCHIACRCGNSEIIITEKTPGKYEIKIDCIGCGNEHIYLLERKFALCKEINVLSCPETGVQQCFVGKEEKVRKYVDTLEKEQDELIDMFGYDSYFKNTRVMFDSLNRIHDIAEQGNITCECGNKDIDLALFPDRIYVKCKKCYAGAFIKASSNEDLKHLLSAKGISVGKQYSEL